MGSRTLHNTPPNPATTYRRPRIIATVVFAAALTVAGCTARATTTTTTHPSAAPVTSAPTPITPAATAPESTGTASATSKTVATPARASCAISPTSGPAGSRTTLTCSGFAPSERVAVTFLAEVLTTAKATAKGAVTSSFPVPSGFAGSHYPGRQDTFQAKGRQSGKIASATFTVTG